MMKLRFGLAVFLSLILGNTYAAVDPVGWSLSPASGFPSVRPGDASTVTYTLRVHPKLARAVVLHTTFAESSKSFTIVDGCNNRSFKPGASCTVGITFTPPDTTQATIQMSYQYNDNVIPVPRLTASGAGHNEGIVGTISGLPTSISLSPQQQPIFTVTYLNTGSADITGFAGNAAGANLLSIDPISSATVAVVSGSNLCGTSSSPVVIKGGHSCTIQGKVTPVSAGAVVVSGLFTYNKGTDTSTPSKTTTVISSGSCFSAEATLQFQSPTLTYADNVLEFTYTNSCSTPQSLGPVTFTSSGASSSPTILGSPYNVAYDHCSNQTIAGTSSCTVLVSVIPQNTGALSVTASATASSVPVIASSSTTVSPPTYNHSVTFVNQCPFPVWYGVAAPGDPTVSPSPNAYLLPKQVPNSAPSTKTITVTASSTSFSGVMLPRTGCKLGSTSFYCQTGDCDSGTNGQCSSTAYEPFTRVEEVFPTATTQGNYDVALEDGPTVPVEFKGLGPVTNQVTSPAASFVCSGAGAPIPLPYPNSTYTGTPTPANGSTSIELGACPWTYTIPNTPAGSEALYKFVTYNGTINSCSDCTSGVCGLAYVTTAEDKNIALSCGNLLGYWSFTTLGTVNYSGNPAYDPTVVFGFNTQLTVANGFQSGYPTGADAYDLYACKPQGGTLASCYNYPTLTTTLCCGGQDWNITGSYGSYLTSQSSNMYVSAPGYNRDWTLAGSLPISPYDSILWMKLACPTGYAYPFDDPSVSFSCNYSDAAQSVAEAMDFEVVYCPGGIVGDLSTNL